jgi:hypothetical protein
VRVASSGRPRRYCSAACRQAAYRERTQAAASADRTALAELATRLRDNADRLWLISQGWTPPGDGTALNSLLTDTITVAEEMFRLGDGTRDATSPD